MFFARRSLNKEVESSRFLGIYLNDHFATATAGVELGRRALKNNPHGTLGELLRRLVVEMARQKDALELVMQWNDTPRSHLKVAAVRLGERLGRLKLNGQLVGYSPLSRVVELQGLNLVSQMRLMLWRTLEQIAEKDGIGGIDVNYLRTQTQEHIVLIQKELEQAAKQALVAGFADTSEGN